MLCLVFFFQAEDGIRDRNVTGVQTCALPICTNILTKIDFVCKLRLGNSRLPKKILKYMTYSYIKQIKYMKTPWESISWEGLCKTYVYRGLSAIYLVASLCIYP